MPPTTAKSDTVATPSPLARELGKRNAFAIPEHEALLNVFRTAAVLNEPFERMFREHGVSSALFNILRIVRGQTSQKARADGVPLGEIGPQMITPSPDVTRLVDRLEKLGLAERRRSDADRRVVLVRLTQKGRRLIAKIDPKLELLHKQALCHLTRRELQTINTLMTKARGGAEPS